jgi:hypothetical protein
MQVKVRAAEGTSEWGEGVSLQLQGIANAGAASEVWTVAGQSVNMFPTSDFVDGLNAPWRTYEYKFNFTAAPALVGQQLGIGLLQIDSDTPPYDLYGIYGWIHADYVRVMALAADDPTPASDWEFDDNLNAAGVANGSTVDVQLEWYTAKNPDANDLPAYENPNPAVTNHYLYITEDSDPNLADPNYVPDFTGVSPVIIAAGAPDAQASYLKTGLNYDSIYIWRVDEQLSGGGFIEGPVWFFETISESPVIIDEPNDVLVAENGTAVFELTVTSTTAESYQWYESADTIPDPGGDDPAISGATSSTLTLNNVPLTDADSYVFCVITNASPDATTSRPALLEVQRQMARWKMDDNLLDTGENAYGYDGSMASPTYQTGIDGKAVEFFNDVVYMEVPGAVDDFNNYHLGLTASVWVNTSTVNWGTMVAKQNRDGSPWTGWVLVTDNLANPSLNIRGVGGVTGTSSVADGQWHLVTATFDGANARIYVDGELEAEEDLSGTIETDNPLYEGTPLDDRPVTIGAEDTNGGTPFVGLIDDVQVFNYALSATGVVDLYNSYVSVADINPCITELYTASVDLSGPAGDPDCKIDLYDIAEMFAAWLEEGCYPNPCP